MQWNVLKPNENYIYCLLYICIQLCLFSISYLSTKILFVNKLFYNILILNKIDNIHIIGMSIRPFLESDSYKNQLKKRISPWIADSWNFSRLRNLAIFLRVFIKKKHLFNFTFSYFHSSFSLISSPCSSHFSILT